MHAPLVWRSPGSSSGYACIVPLGLLAWAILAGGTAPACAAPAAATPANEVDSMNLQTLVPDSLGDWRATGADEFYDSQTIFKYMNGAGEVYLSFDFQRLLVRRFAGPDQETITVELYDMGRPADAFGVFTRNREGQTVYIGQGSEYRSGYVNFWKHRYFVTVFASQETYQTKQNVLHLAMLISEAIPRAGMVPRIVSLLPKAKLDDDSIRYFHKHTDLNQHYFLADDNILQLDLQTEAVIADYPQDDALAYLLIVRYPTAERARAAHDNYVKIFMPEAGASGDAQLEDGTWTSARLHESYLVAVYDAATQERAVELATAAVARIEGGRR